MSFETPQDLDREQDTGPSSQALGELHHSFRGAAAKRGSTKIASEVPNGVGGFPRRYNVDLSRAPGEELRLILQIETNPLNLQIDVADPHTIDPQEPDLVESTFISWSTMDDDGYLSGQSFFIHRDLAYSTEWKGEYESNEGLESPRSITHEEFSRLETLMGYVEYAALAGHLKRS